MPLPWIIDERHLITYHGNTLDRSAVRHLREYLAHARVTPSQYAEGRQAQH